ncbi:Procollagen galactosyltransferase 1 [Neolecta irregularis DAH-3]|uniref:Procollagen galactosyltransferase 1 n=1 Tax=Neolecta irregularis (strain DAH-3) TaxID=1198029 RepID=A0A1U7LTU5_NEOID|nr:Procollagen galactosyltransferase 1 [Neolecta irregularis DAH-3]|eukprot:OLL26087.1 Procollagen galactosyltransferase 1 [Neolecta irregularis DAH-3]
MSHKQANSRLRKEPEQVKVETGVNASNIILQREIIHGKERLGFDHIYVIVASQERKEYSKKILDYHHLEYELFQAQLRDSQIVTDTIDYMKGVLPSLVTQDTPGLIACWASHRSVWQDAINRNYSTILILEDDVDSRIDLVQRMKIAWNQVPDDWQMLLPGYCFIQFDIPNGHIDSMKPVYKVRSAVCTHAYGVKRELLPVLLDITAPRIGEAVDVQAIKDPLESELFRAYGLLPHVINQRPLTAKRNSVINSQLNKVEQGDHLIENDWRRNDQYELNQSTAHQVGADYWINLAD